ncbi:Pentatricopeptide repeat-containing protein [Actinidia chinensis var. chinensis]|uniref:Pentatricopeptide repeat-containing protein n=1 Tax=Actinidia chinensis var. chinensis TaxID=1590841 RepID=A0A2R6PDG3_ACTCC|nr:Pentatricopeptide repeat-containing protein [Actinidia chinensis var. chinensis]
MLTCKQTSHLISTITHCKTIKQLHQAHAQVITRGLLSLYPSISLLLPTLLHSFTSFLSPPPPPPPSSLSTHYAVAVFNTIKNPSTFCYNTIIRAHTLLSLPLNALLFFAQMRRLSLSPDAHTFPFALKACAQHKSLSLAKTLHCQCLKFGFSADVFVVNCLITGYSVTGRIHDACRVFDESPHRDVVSYNALIDGFVKAGETERGREVFDQMPVRDAVSWGTLIAGYAKGDQFKEAIELFDQMIGLGVCPDNIALVSSLSACSQLGELEKGKSIHNYIEQKGIRIDGFLSTSLVDLYAKCGCIETAKQIFELSPEKALFTWNAMLSGLAMHGDGQLLLDYFSRMVKARVRPDGVSFLAVLVGCSHAGLVNEARQLFEEMEGVYGVPRELKHYGCMADLLGRAGLIREAMEMIDHMPMGGDVFVWGGLLSGCRIHGNVEVAEKAAEHVMDIKPEDGGVYSVLANIYANAERWDDLEKIRRLRDSTRVKKNAGCSLIQLDGVLHEFVAGDSLHHQTDREGRFRQHPLEFDFQVC